MARFATAQLIDDVFKATIFETGLRPNIHRALAPFPLVSYADVLTRSLAIEAKEVVLKKDRDASTPSKSVQMSPSQPHWKRQKHQAYSTPYSFQRPPSYPPRSSFRGSYQSGGNRGSFVSQTKTCHRCGDPNHLIRNYPQSHRPSQLVGSVPYQAPSRQSGVSGCWEGISVCSGESGRSSTSNSSFCWS